MIPNYVCSLVITLFLTSIVSGQDKFPNDEMEIKPRKKIEIGYGFFPSYSYYGQKYRNLKDLEDILISLEDRKTTELYKQAKLIRYYSLPFAIIGGISLGSPIGKRLAGGEFDSSRFLVGIPFAVISLFIEHLANKKFILSAERFNQVIEKNYYRSINIYERKRIHRFTDISMVKNKFSLTVQKRKSNK